MPGLGRTLLPALLIVGGSINAYAQQKACEIDEGSPNQVARAILDLQLAQTAAKPEDAAAKLKDAVKLLGEGDMKKNATGRAFVMGKALSAWLAQPTMASGMTTRGAIGFVTDPAAPYDLIAGIDSAFKVVEAANPECVSQTTAYRQQKGWVDLVNKALELSGNNQTDSAVALAKRAILLSPFAPYGYMVLAQAAQKNNQPKDAFKYYKEAINATAKDTAANVVDARRQLQMTLGAYAVELADDASAGADKPMYMQEAKAAYEALAKDPGTKYADAARTGLARLATISGDTSAIKASYADQLANPTAFSYSSLMQAAVTAARANQSKDAIKLFEAARAANSHHRDVLYNLARLYVLDSAYAKGIATARDLIAVDPSNPDNFQLLAIAYASINKGYDAKRKEIDAHSKALGLRANDPKTGARAKSAAIDSAAKLNPLLKAYQDSSKTVIDSAVKYQTMMTSLPAKVSFNEFTPADGKTTVGGTVQNMTDAAKSYTLKIEFLDKSGAVVTSQDVQVGPIQPHGSAKFSATGTGAGIVAFRYAPLT